MGATLVCGKLVEWIAFVGVLVGIIARAAFPYLRKISGGEELKWERRYTASLVASLVLSLIVTLLVFPGFVAPQAEAFSVFVMAFIFGFGFEALVNEASEWANPSPRRARSGAVDSWRATAAIPPACPTSRTSSR